MAEGCISIVCFGWFVLGKKLYQMMTFKTMAMSANLATELTVTAGIFLIDTWTPVMIKVTA